MRKVVIVFALVMFASVAIGQVCMADEKQETMGPRIKVTKIDKKDAIDYIEFLDYFGNTKKKIKMKYFTKEEWEGPEYTEVTALLSGNNKFVAVTETHSKRNTEKDIYFTGCLRNNKRTITLYDEEGKEIFKKKGVSYFPLVISDNGERVVCYDQADESFDFDISLEAEKNLRDKLHVLDKNGKPVFYVEERLINYQFVRISPSGEWLAYKCNISEDRTPHVKIFNINTHEKVADVSDEPVIGLDALTDDGDIARVHYNPVKLPNGTWVLDRSNPDVSIEFQRERKPH